MQKPLKRKRSSGIWPYLLLAPALIIMLSVVVVPIVNAVSMSFQNYNLTKPNKMGWNNFANYEKLLTGDPLFREILIRMILF